MKTRNKQKQDIVIAELAKGATVKDAAAKVSISRHAVQKWNAEDPDYRVRLEAAILQAKAGYVHLIERAAERAAELLEDPDGKVALGAVKIINERGLGPVNASPLVSVTTNNNSVQFLQHSQRMRAMCEEIGDDACVDIILGPRPTLNRSGEKK